MSDKTTLGQENFGERATRTDGPTQDFRSIGETGSNDLGDFATQPGGRDETAGQAQGEETGDGAAIGGAWTDGAQEGQPAERDVEDAMPEDLQKDIPGRDA